MERRVNLKSWTYAGDNSILLKYEDGDVVLISKSDFNRAFGAIVSASKEDVIRDFTPH